MKNGGNMNQSTIIKIMATFMLTFSVSRANSITSENLNIMGLNRIDSQVTWGRAAESLNANFNHINSDMEKMKNASFRNKGYFLTEADMKAAYPTANVGDKAYVGTSESFAIWVYGTNGWKNSEKTGGDESVDLEQYYTKTEVDEIVLTPAKDAAAYAEVAATQATNAATSASESAQSAADAANSAEASKAASETSAKSALAAEEKSKEAAISAFNAKNSASLAVSTAEQAVEIAKDATNTSNDSLETSISNRYGYNVTIHGLKGGIHTLASAVKDVPAKHRMLGQKITFRTENGDWATYHNESLSLDNYTNTDDWVQEVGISSVTGDINITNAPDYEDLTEAADGTLKFADKEYSAESFSGLGRVYLRKNIVDGVNVLTQDMMSKSNTIYIIQYDYDLQGAEITIPEGCLLVFNGGSIKNGYVVGNNTSINANVNKIFELDILLKGTWNIIEAYPEWFGAKGDGLTDDTPSINACLSMMLNNGGTLRLSNKTYCISQSIDLRGYANITIEGSNNTSNVPWIKQSTIKVIENMDYAIKCVDISEELIPENIGKAITIKYIYVDCNNLANVGISCRFMTNLYKIAVRYALQDGILLCPQTYPVYIEHCYSQYNGRHGIYAMAPYSTVYGIRNCELQANKGYGLYIESGVGIDISTVLLQANEQGGLKIKQVESTISGKPAYLWNILLNNIYTEANGTLDETDENYDGNCAVKITGLNTDPTVYAGKIEGITLLNCVINKSSKGVASDIQGTWGIKLINNFGLTKIDDTKNIPKLDQEYRQLLSCIDMSKASTSYNPLGGKIIFPATPLYSKNEYTLDAYAERVTTLSIGDFSNDIQDFVENNAVYTRIGDLVSVSGQISWESKKELNANNIVVINHLPYNIKKTVNVPCKVGDCVISTDGNIIDCFLVAAEESKYVRIYNKSTMSVLRMESIGTTGTLFFNFSYKAKDIDVV